MSRLPLALLAMTLGLTPMARADDKDDRVNRTEARTLSVSGTGKISAAPDVADIHVGVVTEAATARDALSANNQAMAALQAVLKKRGIADKDIQTTGLTVQPRYTQPAPPRPGQAEMPAPRIAGYEVNNAVTIVARDLAGLGPTLDALVTAGANRMNGISFRVSDADKRLDQARRDAIADARRRADLLAGEAGMTVGPPITIQESGGAVPPPRPMMFGATMMRSAAAESVPIAAGEQELSVSVQVVYEMKPAK